MYSHVSGVYVWAYIFLSFTPFHTSVISSLLLQHRIPVYNCTRNYLSTSLLMETVSSLGWQWIQLLWNWSTSIFVDMLSYLLGKEVVPFYTPKSNEWEFRLPTLGTLYTKKCTLSDSIYSRQNYSLVTEVRAACLGWGAAFDSRGHKNCWPGSERWLLTWRHWLKLTEWYV